MALGTMVAACLPRLSSKDPASLMIDCQFRINKHVHMHVSEKRGAITLVSRYSSGKGTSHSEDLRRGLESEGRMIAPGGHRFRFELFLLNDHLGENPGEVVLVNLSHDGRSQLEARALGGAIRVIDTGTCSLPDGSKS